MATGGRCRCELLELQEELLTEDLGTVLINVAKKSIGTLKHKASLADQSLQFEETTMDPEEEGYTLKVEISKYTQAFHLYELMSEKTYTYRFLPTRERILFDSQQLLCSQAKMQDFVAFCKRQNCSIIKMEPRRRLGLECTTFQDIYHISAFCVQKNITDGLFYTTDLAVVTKRELVKNHIVLAKDYN